MANFDVSTLEAFIFDLDGVIWRGDTPIEGVVEAISRLQNAGKRCLYCTNNASSTPADYVEKLATMKITAQEDDVMTSAWATALYLSSQFTGQFSAYVVGEEGLVSMLRKTGARVVTMQGMNPITHDIIEDTAFPVDCVVAGIDRSFNYDKLRLAQRFILNGARFVATNRDATFPVSDGVVPGAGAIVSAIETASGVSPLTIGKPQALMPMLLMQKFDLKAETTAFVGDRLDTDMVAARRSNLRAIFVTTGVSTREAGERARGQQKPDMIFDSLGELARAVVSAISPATPTENLPTLDETVGNVATKETPQIVTEADTVGVANTNVATNGNISLPTLNALAPNATASNATASNATALSETANAIETKTLEVETVAAEAMEVETTTETEAIKSAPPESPLARLLDDDEPQGIEVEPSTSPFSFTLDDGLGGGVTSSRPAPHLAAPSLSKTEEPAAKKADKTDESKDAAITPGKNNKDIDVGEGLGNWWESIEDAFKKS